jgi:GntR family transcriptional regulator of vanillate catabolism
MSTAGILNVAGRPRLVDDVVRILREKIVNGELAPGTQLLQIDLASQLGVSRTPLREAFRILENEGLLRTSNNNRTVEVVTITGADLRDMYEIREVIDGLAARLASQAGLPPKAQAEARRLLDEMAASSKPYNPLRRTEAHAAFHTLFVEHSGNARLRGLIPLIRSSSAALYLPFIDDPDAVELVDAGRLTTHKRLLDESQTQHAAILAAVIEGKADKAETEARRHIRRTLGTVDEMDEWRRIIAEAASHEHEQASSPPKKPSRTPSTKG